MPPIVAFIIGFMALIALSIYPLKLHIFIGLLLSALLIGFLAGMPPVDVVNTVAAGVGKLVTKIGIVIIFGVLLGRYLEISGGGKRMALTFLNAFKKRNAELAAAASGFVVSIPIFSDSGYVILCPFIKSLARVGKVCLPALAVSLSAGLLATHVFVPPTPGPLAVAALLEIDIGRMIAYGLLAALGMTLAGWAFSVLYLKKKYPTFYTTEEFYGTKEATGGESEEETGKEEKLPTKFSSFFPIAIPMILILLNTVGSMVLPEESTALMVLKTIGNPNVALMIGAGVAALMLRKFMGEGVLGAAVADSLKIAAPIIFITSAASGMSAILKASGAGPAVAEVIAASGMPILLGVFLVGGVLKTVTGSGTTAVMTGAALASPFIAMGVSPLLVALALGSGARLVCHLNDSYFWVYTRMTGFETTTSLRTLTLGNVAMALGGFVVVLILAAVGIS